MTDQSLSETPQIDLDAFNQRIAEIASDGFSREEPVLINRLGIELGQELRSVKAATGLSLMQYIREHLADRYEISEIKPNTPALWPKGKVKPRAPSKTATQGRNGRSGSRRFQSWFWQAFSTPLSPDCRRFYVPATREVVDEQGEGGSNWIEVPSALVWREDEIYDVRLVHERIQGWLRSHGLDAEAFRELPETKGATSEPLNLLEVLLDSLDNKQRQATSLSLDVVSSLLSRKF